MNTSSTWADGQPDFERITIGQQVAALCSPRHAVNLILAATVGGFWVASYWETIVALLGRWNSDPNYGHGYLVPFVTLYLAYQNYFPAGEKQPARPELRGGVLLGSLLALIGLAVRYVTLLMPSMVIECFSMLTVLAGLVLLLGGRGAWSRLGAPLSFLVFMVPWPSVIYSRIAFPLQLFVSKVAAVLLQVVGIPVLRDGNLIHLPGQTMHVAEACSGLRQLTAFLAICTCAFLLLRRPRWYRVLLLASSIPIAVVINVLRVTGTGLMLTYGDPAWTEGTLHTLEGMVMVGLGLGLLMLEVSLLDWLLEKEPARPAAPRQPQPVSELQ